MGLSNLVSTDKTLAVVVSKMTQQQSTGLFVLRVYFFFQIIATLQLIGILDNNIPKAEDTGKKVEGRKKQRQSVNEGMTSNHGAMRLHSY